MMGEVPRRLGNRLVLGGINMGSTVGRLDVIGVGGLVLTLCL